MPNLPTVSVTQEQADRILAAFGSVASYTDWLKRQVRDAVLTIEDRKDRAVFEAERQAKDVAARQALEIT